ncbi:Glutamate receptor ionotropic, kainate 1 [Trichoplax sp. H2]|nr:Glutamate receptor ionotropic, kainate 1 [Trichoplax sp. H2]|eukprot:RDD40176.1 Glutamate receptor ionotropic, kainate 1 [Trichoplax sp. H2]
MMNIISLIKYCIWIYFVLSNAEVHGKMTVRIGVIIPTNLRNRQAIELAITEINSNAFILNNIHLSADIYESNLYRPYENVQAACQIIRKDVWAIIGPLTSSDVRAVQNLCAELHIPQISPSATNPGLENKPNFPFLIRMSPSDYYQGKMVGAVFERFRWTYAAIFVSNTDFGINSVAQFQVIASSKGWRILSFEKFATSEINNPKIIQTYLSNIKATGAKIILLSCLSQQAAIILEEANNLNMTTVNYLWILLGGTTDQKELIKPLDHLKSAMNIQSSYKNGNRFQKLQQSWTNKYHTDLEPMELKYYDSVWAFAYGLQRYLATSQFRPPSNLSCSSMPLTSWNEGPSLFSSIVQSSGEGATGKIAFNSLYGPAHTSYEIKELIGNTWSPIATWTNNNGLVWKENSMNNSQNLSRFSSALEGRFFNVTSVLLTPFTVEKTGDNLVGNDRYEGFMVDLLNRLSQDLKFKYELHLVPDGQYGAYRNGSWDGMIKELLDDTADIAAATLTITPQRSTAVKFSIPFHDQGTTILIRKPEIKSSSIFQFFAPFTFDLWIAIIGFCLLIAVCVHIITRLSPFGFFGSALRKLKLPESISDENAINIYKKWKQQHKKSVLMITLRNSLWHAITAFLQQGSDATPRNTSGRMVTGLWWFASCILIASYTANLAAFLTVDQLKSDIDSLAKLVSQNAIRYGTLEGSSLDTFIRNSATTPYYEMSGKMDNVKNLSIAISRVLSGRYAYLGDSTTLNFIKNRNCILTTTGGEFLKDNFGLAFSKSSPYAAEFNTAILQLRQNNFIAATLKKWYARYSSCLTSSTTGSTSNKVQMSFQNTYGVFILLLAGIGAGFLTLVVEWLIDARQEVDFSDPKKPKSILEAMKRRARKLIRVYKLKLMLDLGRYKTKKDNHNHKNKPDIDSVEHRKANIIRPSPV